MRNYKRWNLLFMGLVYIPYLLLSWTIYRDVGFQDWNFQNTLPTANVSPFMISTMPLLLLVELLIRPLTVFMVVI